MNSDAPSYDLVLGLGETGGPLLELLKKSGPAMGLDLEPVPLPLGRVNALHICFPFRAEVFQSQVVRAIRQHQPQLTIIHATVIPGTTKAIASETGTHLAYSPIRGKHSRMQDDLMRYTKFVAGVPPAAGVKAADHLQKNGFLVKLTPSSDALELSKLAETTYFGLLVAWAQEVERFSRTIQVNYEEAMALSAEVDYLPPVIFQPGFIGGHCVIPNLSLLEKVRSSPFVDLIRSSNEAKKEEWQREGRDLNARIAPKQIPR